MSDSDFWIHARPLGSLWIIDCLAIDVNKNDIRAISDDSERLS